jgi:hypothetical protein
MPRSSTATTIILLSLASGVRAQPARDPFSEEQILRTALVEALVRHDAIRAGEFYGTHAPRRLNDPPCVGLREMAAAFDGDEGHRYFAALRQCEKEASEAPPKIDRRAPPVPPTPPEPLVALVLAELARGPLTEGEQAALRAYFPRHYLIASRACKQRAIEASSRASKQLDSELDRCVADALAILWARVATAACRDRDFDGARAALPRIAPEPMRNNVERCLEAAVAPTSTSH